MVKLTGTLHIDTGFVRLKPNINFIGAKQGLSVYDLSKLLEIELNPTPAEGLYLVDYTIDINSGFLPTEHWLIPNEDCTFDEIRGIKKLTSNLTETLEAKVFILESENNLLKDTQDTTTKEQQEYSAYARNLEKQLEDLKQEYKLYSAYTKNLEAKLENLVLENMTLRTLNNETQLNSRATIEGTQKTIKTLTLENTKLVRDAEYIQNLETQLSNLQKDYEIKLGQLNSTKLLQEQIETLTIENAKLSQITEKAESIDSRVNSSLDILKRFS